MKLLRPILLTLLAACGLSVAWAAELANGVKAVVNDSVVTYGQIEADAALLADELMRQYGRQPALLEQKYNQAKIDSLEKALERLLILQDFKVSGYNLPESVIDEVVQEEIRSRFGDRATLTKTLQAQGITYEKWRQQARDRFIVSQLQAKNVFRESVVSPHKIETYYLQRKGSFTVEEQIKLRMIVLNKQPDGDNPTTLRLAEEILAKLKDGAAFSEMAGIYSQGSQRSQGGEWGWVERSVLRKELADVAFALKPGELSAVIDTAQAAYVMLVEEKRATYTKPLADVREEIERTLVTQERERLQKQYIEKLRKKIFVRYF
jgi:peptidyl-prolyl cis-trans isomerase SurA